MEKDVVSAFRRLAQRANYQELSMDQLKESFDAVTLIELRTQVDLDDFDAIACFTRGDVFEPTRAKEWWFWEKEIQVDIYRRVVLLLELKDAEHFRAKGERLEELKFTPGEIYLYAYKNVPKFDVELLFPNVKVSMTWKDRLLFGVPAIGASVPVIFKVLPQILIVTAAIGYFAFGPKSAEELGVDESQVRKLMPVLTAVLALGAALGGLAVKQYMSYKNKRIKFQKDVSDTLFFRNLASNTGVITSLIDSAEDEDLKEAILVYHHLLTHGPITVAKLDAGIEHWLREECGEKIDFDVEGAVRFLESLKGSAGSDDKEPIAVVNVAADDTFAAIPIDEALHLLDRKWDEEFRFSARAA